MHLIYVDLSIISLHSNGFFFLANIRYTQRIQNWCWNVTFQRISWPYRISHTGWNLTFQSTEWILNGGWMATEWWRDWLISVVFQPSFSDHSVDWMAGTFQWPFSQLILWKIKLRPTLLEPGMNDSKRKYANHCSTATAVIREEYLVYI